MTRFILTLLALSSFSGAAIWPTYRHDNRRSGVSSGALKLPLVESWIHFGGPPQQAWTGPAKWDAFSGNEGLQSMRNFDPCHFTTAAHGLIYYGSSSDNAVHCLKASTGEEQWHHFTNSSVRFPPTILEKKVWFGSDDGFVYCADALTGKTLWKKQAAPSDRLIPSNGKLISPWPVRTGITIEDGRAFFAASLLPWKTSYLWCIDAKTADKTYLTEHQGVTLQGAMLAGGDRLYIPQGRAAPIALNQNDGKKTGTIGQAGGVFCLLTEDNQLIAGPPNQKQRDQQLRIADPDSGKSLTTFNNTTRAVVAKGKAYLHSINKLQCLDLLRKGQLEALLTNHQTELKKLDPKVEANLVKIESLKKEISTIQTQIKACLIWTIEHPAPFELVVAGDQLIVGLDNQVSILSTKTGKSLWQAPVTGKAYGITAAEGRLIVSTDLGHIHTFHSQP
ncbi:MAG: PQQ-binding-like beta-propeller repeat protein [Akkermansiaceae bacterium]|jgi:outer membrane protein assembly factor BamB|nr:PQQ-binding-like beta-propeller repeat protein [Akkermansiaceae bacterium]